MFDSSKCDFCGECLSKCHYLPFDKESGSVEIKKLINGEEVSWLYDCVTCIACNEYCPKDARPFDLILQRMEERGDFTDKALRNQMAERFRADGEPRPMEVPKGKAMSTCVMQGSMPWAIQGQLFENIPIIKGKHYFCNVLFAHMGDESIMRERLQGMVDNLAKSGTQEIVFVHDDCYAVLKGIAPEYGIKLPFRPIHFFEYLLDYLKEHKGSIKKLGMTVAYQRPCASRYTPEKEPMLDEIFELIGITRAKREYDGINAMCCGVEVAGPGLRLFPRGKNYEPFKDKNIADGKANSAEAFAYLCPMCFASLSAKVREVGMKNYMISDLCRLALGEELPQEKPA